MIQRILFINYLYPEGFIKCILKKQLTVATHQVKRPINLLNCKTSEKIEHFFNRVYPVFPEEIRLHKFPKEKSNDSANIHLFSLFLAVYAAGVFH